MVTKMCVAMVTDGEYTQDLTMTLQSTSEWGDTLQAYTQASALASLRESKDLGETPRRVVSRAQT